MLKNFRLHAMTIAAFMLFMMLATLWISAFAAQTKPSSKDRLRESKQVKQMRGRWDMADGLIKDVTCKGRAMDMTFDDSEETLHLQTDDYFKVKFSAINFTPSGTMNPSKTAKGMYARVYYYHIKGHPREGELISVQLRK